MKLRAVQVLILFFLPLAAAAQLPPLLAEYRSAANVPYWANQVKPGSYWQQDVHYAIDAKVLPAENRVDGDLVLTYYNNSPDTLHQVFFHLYQNAFTPGSYNDERLRTTGWKPKYGPYESQGKGCQILSISQNQSAVTADIDNTIARVKLATPLLPNSHTKFTIKFSTWWDDGDVGRRMKLLYSQIKRPSGKIDTVKHFDGVHWYPRICAYDRKMGWDTEQHLGYEFYGDFGAFEVSLTFPEDYVLDATGVLQNRSEVLPDDLRRKLDVANFKDKPWDEAASEIIPPSDRTKTWRFKAMNVHDFAFTADPTYRIGEAEWQGVSCISLARESHARGWQDAASFTARIIELYSTDIGRYLYPKMIVADADDGMEYPMLTLDGGSSPGYYGLLCHEVGHNWFFGMVGSNETYRALLDEGFTQFLTAWSMTKLVGPTSGSGKEKTDRVYSNAMAGYINQANLGFDGVITTNSAHFPDGYNYRMVYPKTSTMLYNLRYVLGDEVFLRAMQHYFDKWKLAHPYVEDFRDAITEYVNTDLTWFFDQWLDTDKSLDYAVKNVKQSEGGAKVAITFERQGEMQMPLDFVIITQAKDTLRYTVPNSWYAKNEPGLTVLPKWTGFELLNKTYTAEISLPGKFKKVIIDPTNRLADVDKLDNQSGLWPMKGKLSLMPDPATNQNDWLRYRWNARPNLWWNGYSGLQVGISVNGHYLNTNGRTFLGLWYNTGLGQINTLDREPDDLFQKFSWKYTYSTAIRRLGPLFTMNVNSMFRDGVHRHSASAVKRFTRGSADNPRYIQFSGGYTFLLRPFSEWTNYLNPGTLWNVNRNNAWFWMAAEKNYPFLNGSGNLRGEIRNSSLGSAPKYSILRGEAKHNVRFKKFQLRLRMFGQYADGALPFESKLYLAGGSPEEMIESDYFRARGFFPGSFLDNNLGRNTSNVHFGGGLNLRGYTGYEAEFPDGGAAWYGNSGASVNAELEFGRYLKWQPAKLSNFLQLHSYLFADAGVIARSITRRGFDEPELSVLRADAGLGFALDIRERHYLQTPLTLRLDLPLWLNRPSANEEFFQFRWVMSVGRAF